MTAIASSGTLIQQLYQRLFDRIDTDADDALSFDEMNASSGVGSKAEAAFNALDTDGDGRVVRAEMTPSSTFGADTLNAMLSAQSDQAPQTNEEIIESLFARADADSDGALSTDEMKAEAAIQRAAGLDAGYSPDTVFMSKDRDGDGLVRPDEVLAVRRLHIPASAIKSADDMAPELAARIREATRAYGEGPTRGGQVSPSVESLTPEARQARLDQFRADLVERSSGPAGTTRYLSRELDGLREKAREDVDQAPITDGLATRLMQRVLAGWSTTAADVSASSPA